MFKHGRHGAFATAVVIGLALLTPASAFAGHDLVIYKQEAHVDLTSDEKVVTVSCNSGDHAVDGMWRIDHADQDEYIPDLELISTAVDVLKAAPSGVDDSTYEFLFTKNAIGNAQLKVFVTCLADKTVGGAHNHDLSGAFDTTTPGTYHSTTVPLTGATPGTVVSTPDCTGKKVLVSPGFEVTSITNNNNIPPDSEPEPGMNRLLESHYTSSTMKSWTWSFTNVTGVDSVVTVTWRCMDVKVPVGGSATDKHKFVRKYRTAGPFNLAKNKVSEVQLHCKDHYKAAVAGFRIDPTGWDYVWYLGMDPRPKTRAFRFANRDTVSTWPVTLSALCINYRTT